MKGYAASGTFRNATATGLTGLDQTGASFSIGFWTKIESDAGGIWWHLDNQASPTTRNGIQVRYRTGGREARFAIATAAAVTNVDTSAREYFLRQRWAHYEMVYDGVAVLFCRFGAVIARTAATAVPGAAGTRETVIGGDKNANAMLSSLFDLQVFPNRVLSLAECRVMADPRRTLDGCKQRLFRNWKPGASGTIRDESGNGNDLTASATLSECDSAEEPPWRRLIAGARY